MVTSLQNDRYQTRKAIAHKRNAHGLKRTCNSNHAKQMRTNATTEQMNTKKKQSITQINVFHCIAVRFQPASAEAVQFAQMNCTKRPTSQTHVDTTTSSNNNDVLTTTSANETSAARRTTYKCQPCKKNQPPQHCDSALPNTMPSPQPYVGRQNYKTKRAENPTSLTFVRPARKHTPAKYFEYSSK